MIDVSFQEEIRDELLKFAVTAARSGGKWVFVRRWDRTSLEFPGGHREPGETIEEAGERELREETGALRYTFRPVTPYSVTVRETGITTCGMLFAAELLEFGKLDSEIEEVRLMDSLPENWTYPEIQPKLLAEVVSRGIFEK